MNRAQFPTRILSLRHASMASEQQGVVRAGTMLLDLMVARRKWADEALLSMVAGELGADIQDLAIAAITTGCPGRTSDGSMFGLARPPFAYWCVVHKRVDVLRALLDQGVKGFPNDIVLATHAYARTESGRLLDQMSTSTTDQPIYRSFPQVLKDWWLGLPAASRTDAAVLLADVDPTHGDIVKELTGTECGAVVAEALMNKRIRAGSASNESALAAPAQRRCRVV